jgi:hypothetical protein
VAVLFTDLAGNILNADDQKPAAQHSRSHSA